MDGVKSSHVAYVENNKVIRSTETYYKPQKFVLGGKTYDNIVSKQTIPNKHDTYTIFTTKGSNNQIRVRHSNGSVLDIGEQKQNLAKRKMMKPIGRVVTVAKNLIALFGMHYL